MAEDKNVGKDIFVERFSDFDDLRIGYREWDAFVEANGGDIFMTHDWCRTWWNHYGCGRTLCILLIKDEDGLLAIVPLCLESIRAPIWKLRIVKLVGADSSILQFALPIRKGHCDRAMVAALSYLRDHVGFDAMALGPLSGLGDIEGAIRSAGTELGLQVAVAVHHQQTYFYPKKDSDSYLSSLSRRERRNMRRAYRYFQGISADGIVVEEANQDTLDMVFAEFTEAHQEFWRSRRKLGHFGDWPRSTEFHREMARRGLGAGRLRLSKYRVGDQVMGYDYGYQFGNVYYDFLNARADAEVFRGQSLGKVIVFEVLKMAGRDGLDTVDSMRGLYEYKLKLGGVMENTKVLHVIDPTRRTRAARTMLRAWAWAIHTLYYRIWFGRCAPHLLSPDRRRGLCRLWVRTNLLR